MGISPTSVQRHARRLDVWREDWTDRPKLQQRAAQRPLVLLEKHRGAWISFRRKSHATAKALPKGAFNAYRYLLKHDRIWLTENHPLERPLGQPRIDWAARDKEWTSQAMGILNEWKSTGHDARPSGSSIGKMLGHYGAVVRNKERLPRLWGLIFEPPS
jgi:hypothetical protein